LTTASQWPQYCKRNEALDTFVYAHAALHGLIGMGLRLNEEVAQLASPFLLVPNLRCPM
jgi:phage terminase large subunit GpA-like protein